MIGLGVVWFAKVAGASSRRVLGKLRTRAPPSWVCGRDTGARQGRWQGSLSETGALTGPCAALFTQCLGWLSTYCVQMARPGMGSGGESGRRPFQQRGRPRRKVSTR